MLRLLLLEGFFDLALGRYRQIVLALWVLSFFVKLFAGFYCHPDLLKIALYVTVTFEDQKNKQKNGCTNAMKDTNLYAQ